MLCVHLNRHGFQRLLWLTTLRYSRTATGTLSTGRSLPKCSPQRGVAERPLRALACPVPSSAPAVPDEASRSHEAPLACGRVWRSMWPVREVLGFRGAHEAGLVFRKRMTDVWLLRNSW